MPGTGGYWQPMPGKQVKNWRVYEAVKRSGASKTKAAKIANAAANGTLNRGGRKRRGKR
jgi:hypothetical protein